MSKSPEEEKNKSIVLEAFDTLFNKRDFKNALTFWSPKGSSRSRFHRDARLLMSERMPAKHAVPPH
jgi:hypothetical protein